MEHTASYTKEELIERVKKELPSFYEMCQVKEGDVVMFHQDAFAADLQVRELELLGIAIKVAGFFNKRVEVIFGYGK